MEKILVSACLLGEKTKYNGHSNYNEKVRLLLEKYEIVPFCPEMEGGLPCPRHPSEIVKDRVKMDNGRDVTKQFKKGAELALNICLYLGIKIAVLKENSPSCGSHKVYDGTFSGKLKDGMGVTADLLKRKGIKVISEDEIDTLL